LIDFFEWPIPFRLLTYGRIFWKISVPALPGLYNKTLEGAWGIDPKGLIRRVDEGSGAFLLMGCRLDGLH
jgi:hypothetical protein